MIRFVETPLHPTRTQPTCARPALLSLLLRDFDADGKGFAGAEAAWLEALADDYLFFIGSGDAEVKDAWSEFYGRVSRADRRP